MQTHVPVVLGAIAQGLCESKSGRCRYAPKNGGRGAWERQCTASHSHPHLLGGYGGRIGVLLPPDQSRRLRETKWVARSVPVHQTRVRRDIARKLSSAHPDSSIRAGFCASHSLLSLCPLPMAEKRSRPWDACATIAAMLMLIVIISPIYLFSSLICKVIRISFPTAREKYRRH